MTTNQSYQLFVRLISEKHAVLIRASNDLFRILADGDESQKKVAANATLKAAQDLGGVLSGKDIPPWLSNAINCLLNYTSGGWKASDLLNNFIQAKISMGNHQWSFKEGIDDAFDFDSIFEHFKKESRLPELFDQIIRLLEEIESSGEVDSVTMLRSLGKVVSTLKRSKDGSYFSFNAAWEFLLSFLNNYMWGELSKLPMLGTALEALEKTIREADEEMFSLHNKIKEKMISEVGLGVKALANKSTFPFVSYDRKGHMLPSLPSLPMCQLKDVTV